MRSPSQRWRPSIDERTPPRLVAFTIRRRRRLDGQRVGDVERDQAAVAGVAHAFDRGVRLEPPRELGRGLGMAAHARLERRETPQQGAGSVGRRGDARVDSQLAAGARHARRGRSSRRGARRAGRSGTSSPSGGRRRRHVRAPGGRRASRRSRRRRRGRGGPRARPSRAASASGSRAPRPRRCRRRAARAGLVVLDVLDAEAREHPEELARAEVRAVCDRDAGAGACER